MAKNAFQEMMQKAFESVEENSIDTIEKRYDDKELFLNKEIELKECKKPFNYNESQKKLKKVGLRLETVYKQIAEFKAKERALENYYKVNETSMCVNPFLVNGEERKAFYKKGFVYVYLGKDEKSSTEQFKFADLQKETIESIFEDGEKLVFKIIGGYFHIAKQDEVDRIKIIDVELSKLYKEKKELSTDVSVLKENLDNFIFWQNYNIPFKFVVDIKPVGSGLTENSWGDGSNRATVYHIILKEELKNGRIKRDINDFLCSQPKGKHFYSEPNRRLDDDTQNIVTCKQCLKAIEKYKIKKGV